MRKIRVLVVAAEVDNCASILMKLHEAGYDLDYAHDDDQVDTIRDIFMPDIVVFGDWYAKAVFKFLDTFGTVIPILSMDNRDDIRKQLPDYIQYAEGLDDEHIMSAIDKIIDPLRQDLAWLDEKTKHSRPTT